ncbi:methionyl-tRNA formyltransferase [Mycoplasmoides genitalium]
MFKIVFFGTSTLSKKCLEQLFYDNDFEICAVVTQPDKINHRNNKIVSSDVKSFCLEKNITFFQPKQSISIKADLEKLKADIGICVSFGQYLHQDIIDLFPNKVINLHPSKLPLLRGGAPLHWTIINGFKKSALSVIQLVKKMDAGPIWKQQDFLVNNDWNTGDLSIYVEEHSPSFLIECTKEILNKKGKWFEQIGEPTFGLNIRKEQEHLDLNQIYKSFLNWVKGLAPKPGGWLSFEGKNIKIFKAKYVSKSNYKHQLGEIVNISRKGINIALKSNEIISIEKIQIPGKRVKEVSEIINGKHPFVVGKCFK